LQSRLEEIRETDARVLSVCVDSVETNAKVVENLDLDFPILSDPDLKVIKAFGLLHKGGYAREGADVARPAVFVLDQQGVVRWRHLTDNWRKRVRPEVVLEQLSKIP